MMRRHTASLRLVRPQDSLPAKTSGGITKGVLVVSLLVVIGVLSMTHLGLVRHILSLMFLVGATFFFTQAIAMWTLRVVSWWEALLVIAGAAVELLIAVWVSPTF